MASDRPNAAEVLKRSMRGVGCEDELYLGQDGEVRESQAASAVDRLREAVNAGPDDAVTIEPDGTLTLSTFDGYHRGVPTYSSRPGAKP